MGVKYEGSVKQEVDEFIRGTNSFTMNNLRNLSKAGKAPSATVMSIVNRYIKRGVVKVRGKHATGERQYFVVDPASIGRKRRVAWNKKKKQLSSKPVKKGSVVHGEVKHFTPLDLDGIFSSDITFADLGRSVYVAMASMADQIDVLEKVKVDLNQRVLDEARNYEEVIKGLNKTIADKNKEIKILQDSVKKLGDKLGKFKLGDVVRVKKESGKNGAERLFERNTGTNIR